MLECERLRKNTKLIDVEKLRNETKVRIIEETDKKHNNLSKEIEDLQNMNKTL